jgi:hypothetical protein
MSEIAQLAEYLVSRARQAFNLPSSGYGPARQARKKFLAGNIIKALFMEISR